MSATPEKNGAVPGEGIEHLEDAKGTLDVNLVYEDDQQPELHARTYCALAAMFLLNLVQVFCLMGPPAGVRKSTRRTQRLH